MKLTYRKSADTYRVWNEEMDKYGQFIVLDADQFHALEEVVKSFEGAPTEIKTLLAITLEEADD